MTVSQRWTVHILGVTWACGNAWAWQPVHKDTALNLGLIIALVVANPVIFALLGWLGRRQRYSSAVIWAILVVVSWVLSPALGAAARWGWGTFLTFMVSKISWMNSAYYSLCIALYFVFRWCRTYSRHNGSIDSKAPLKGCEETGQTTVSNRHLSCQ
jgi:hypothetical protein